MKNLLLLSILAAVGCKEKQPPISIVKHKRLSHYTDTVLAHDNKMITPAGTFSGSDAAFSDNGDTLFLNRIETDSAKSERYYQLSRAYSQKFSYYDKLSNYDSSTHYYYAAITASDLFRYYFSKAYPQKCSCENYIDSLPHDAESHEPHIKKKKQ